MRGPTCIVWANLTTLSVEVHTTCWEDNEGIRAWAAAQGLVISDGTEATGGEGSVFG
jgi:hypothetical protein